MRKSYKRIIVIFILNFRYKKFIKKPLTQVYQITCMRGYLVYFYRSLIFTRHVSKGTLIRSTTHTYVACVSPDAMLVV